MSLAEAWPVDAAKRPDLGGHASIDDALDTMRAHPAFLAEAMTLMRLGPDEARVVPGDLGIPGVALRSHCTYRRDEILAGIGWVDGTRKTRGQAAGVVYSEATNVDASLVTLRREDSDFAPSTRYRDYPISADLFHRSASEHLLRHWTIEAPRD